MSYPPPAPPVVGGHPANHSGTDNHPPTRVVIHSAVVPCEPGRARQLAAWNRDGTTGGSWHYATDPAETIQCSWDSYVCHAAPPNPRSLHIEMADTPTRRPTERARRRALRKGWRWAGRNHRRMLHRTARLTAGLCLAYDLPLTWLTADELRKGRAGITSHANVTAAWHQSTHWDPGWWPRAWFMRLVRRYAAELEAEHAAEVRGGRS